MPNPAKRRSTTRTAPPITANANRWNASTTGKRYTELLIVWPIHDASHHLKKGNSIGLQLLLLVEPVVRDHSTGDNNACPEDDRREPGHSGRRRRARASIPFRYPAKGAILEDPGIQDGEHQHHRLNPK